MFYIIYIYVLCLNGFEKKFKKTTAKKPRHLMAEDSKTDSWYFRHHSSKGKRSKFIMS